MGEINYTPMVQQYMTVKKEHPNELLFFRLGDFYELFLDDAICASRELNITLTKRAGGSENMPMCGVPYHAVDGYIAKLVRKGYRIAICEQMEDPKQARGIVKRQVIKIITPGTALNENILEDKHNRYLVLLKEREGELCLAACDVSTGECLWFVASGKEAMEQIKEQLFRLQPAELVLAGAVKGADELTEWLSAKVGPCALSYYHGAGDRGYFARHFGEVTFDETVVATVECLLDYLHATVMADLSHINRLEEIMLHRYMQLDAAAIRNLELVRNLQDGSRQGSLLGVLDHTKTSMGARKLRQYLDAPLLDIAQIAARQDAVEELTEREEVRAALAGELSAVADLERILSRIEVGSANARDLAALRASLAVLPAVKEVLGRCKSPLWQKLERQVEVHAELYKELQAAIVDEPPFSIREGGLIRDGYHKELDELRLIARDSTAWLRSFEQRIKEECGIKTMRVGYNKVFGYYIEVSKGQSSSVPAYFSRKQTLVNAERYIVPELKDFENKVLGAKEKTEQLEYHLFNELRQKIRESLPRIQTTARAIAVADVLASLADCARLYHYVRPALNDRGEISIKEGRHPVVERLLKKELFVPNDAKLNNNEQNFILITGPNMAGKSTYMRQVALLVLLTQLGSFIPAASASVCPVDRIFTRVGASDDLTGGQSTFMVEMREVAEILRHATKDSLIILDEVGRGTSTFDGMSIAQAVLEYIQSKLKAKTLFATHYHQLIALEGKVPGVKNYSVAVKERGKDIVFLRRIVPGGSDRSYGIHVARLAGLPKPVLERSEEILAAYDSAQSAEKAPPQEQKQESEVMGSLFGSGLVEELLRLDVMSITPIEALNLLYKLQAEAKKEAGA